jgi:protein involved in polysaccharide export with SLBB domain
MAVVAGRYDVFFNSAAIPRGLCVLVAATIGAWSFGPALHAQPVDDRLEAADQKAAPSDAAIASASNISNAQEVRLRFSDYANLNGSYRINPDQTVSIPVVGRVAVGGLDAAGLERAIAQKASSITGRQTYVTVEIAEYRPIYVTGLVNRAGAVQWQPKMTVLQAVASAGGLLRSGPGAFDEVQFRKMVDDQKRSLAAYARAQAELQGSTEIPIPRRLVELVGEKEAAALIEGQSKILLARSSALKTQLKVLGESKDLAVQELAALREQKKRLTEILGLRREHGERIDQLFAKGLAVTDVVLQQKLELSSLEERSANLSVAIVRIQSTISDFDRQMSNATNARRGELESELMNLDHTISQTELELTGRTDSKQARGRANAAAALTYAVTRASAAGTTDIEGNSTTELLPGDVLTVSRAGS